PVQIEFLGDDRLAVLNFTAEFDGVGRRRIYSTSVADLSGVTPVVNEVAYISDGFTASAMDLVAERAGSRAFVGFSDNLGGVLQVINAEAASEMQQIPLPGDSISHMAVSGDGSTLVVGARGSEALLVYALGGVVECDGDANGDLVVNVGDFIAVLLNFGSSGDGVAGDANDDDVVNVADFIAVLLNFGAACV
ncbi:MAG: hypothetical protein AAGB34_09420, partial [Planctomycetota bacterium]